MRIVVAFIFICWTASAVSQVYSPVPIACEIGSFLPVVNEPTSYACHALYQDFAFDAFNPEQLIAEQAIDLESNVDLTISGGGLDVVLQPRGLDLAWFEPASTPLSVPVYEKLEVGIDLPQTIDEGINEFLVDPEVLIGINPYNPEELDVYAVVTGPLGNNPVTKRINPFYYQEYERNHPYTSDAASRVPSTHPNDHYGLWDWIPIDQPYRFRLRHSVMEQGLYNVEIHAKTPNDTWRSGTFQFEAVAPENERGFVRRSDQVRYLEHANGELYFPIGHQVGAHDKGLDWKFEWRKDYIYDAECSGVDLDNEPGPDYTLECNECVERNDQPWSTFESDSETYAQGFYIKALDELEELANAGANTGRVVLMPWNYDIEYEYLNNYSNRMHCAWEFDRFLDKASALDMHLIVNLQAQYPFQYEPFDLRNWDWEPDFKWETLNATNPGYCYRTQLNGLEEPLDFFKSGEALEIYKRKIRYYIARFGYSRQISLMELLAEVDGTTPRLGSGGLSVEQEEADKLELHSNNVDGAGEAIQVWQEEISRFIKDSLDHTEHLLGVHYLLNGPTPESEDDSYGIPWIDVMGESRYTNFITDPFGPEISHIAQQVGHHNKPFYWSEYDILWQFVKCSRPVSSVRNMMLTGFTGAMGIGMSWDNWNYQDHDHWDLYGNVASFFESLPLHTESWSYKATSPATDDNAHVVPKSRVVMYSGDCHDLKMVGAICNYSYNQYTQREADCDCTNPTAQIFSNPDNAPNGCKCNQLIFEDTNIIVDWSSLYEGNPTNLDFNDPYEMPYYVTSSSTDCVNESFFVRWYDPFTGEYLGEAEEVFPEVQSPVLYKIPLEHPNLIVDQRPIVFFELWNANLPGLRALSMESGPLVNEKDQQRPTESIAAESPSLKKISGFRVFPNPSLGQVMLENLGENSLSVELYSATGGLIQVLNIDENQDVFLTLSSGSYIFRAISVDGVQEQKLIVTK